jgi:hypothetical protein
LGCVEGAVGWNGEDLAFDDLGDLGLSLDFWFCRGVVGSSTVCTVTVDRAGDITLPVTGRDTGGVANQVPTEGVMSNRNIR